MKKAFISLVIILMTVSAFDQKVSKQFIFNTGIKEARMYEDGGYQSNNCSEGCFPLNQTSNLSFDFNVLYQVQSRTTNLKLVYGLGINQKSWTEVWINTQGLGPINMPYHLQKNLTYMGIFYGINYDFPLREKTKIVAGSLLNPEILVSSGNNDSFNSVAGSIRMTLGLEHQVSDQIAIRLTPFFQSAVMNYANTPLFIGLQKSRNTYTPYAFGVNLGIVFKRIRD